MLTQIVLLCLPIVVAILATYLLQISQSSKIPLEYLYGLFGGALIGVSAVMFLIFHGRVTGISGIFARILDHAASFGIRTVKFASCSHLGFLCGLFLSGIFWNYRRNYNQKIDLFGLLPQAIHGTSQIPYHPYVMGLSGILVGVGTRLGSGCTSGHGVCGLARSSPRSVAAVLTFMAFGIFAATVTSRDDLDDFLPFKITSYYHNHNFYRSELSTFSQYVVPSLTALLFLASIGAGSKQYENESIIHCLPSVFCGFLFGTGLIYSGMTKPTKVRAFLNFNPVNFTKHFDPTLMFVLVGALCVTMILYPLVLNLTHKPLLHHSYRMPTSTKIDKRLLTGAAIFGTGWGLGGVCPGPGLVALASTTHSSPMWVWFGGLLIGMRVYSVFLAKKIT